MSIRPHAHRLPRARIDPITDGASALRLVRAAVATPTRAETLVVLLDDEHRGLTIVSVDGTDQPDHVLEVIECFTRPELVESGVGAIIVASVRPSDECARADDADRWFELCDTAEQAGVELLEWFVIGRSVRCPRDLVGVPPRWRGPDVRSA